MLFAGRGNEVLSSEIASCLGMPLGKVELSDFANGEIYGRYAESVRGADLFVIQSHCPPVNDHIKPDGFCGFHGLLRRPQQ